MALESSDMGLDILAMVHTTHTDMSMDMVTLEAILHTTSSESGTTPHLVLTPSQHHDTLQVVRLTISMATIAMGTISMGSISMGAIFMVINMGLSTDCLSV